MTRPFIVDFVFSSRKINACFYAGFSRGEVLKLVAALFVIFTQVSVFAADVRPAGYFSTPDVNGPVVFLKSIKEAKTYIRMWMFTINNRKVIDELAAAAQRSVKVSLILHHGTYNKSPVLVKRLQDAGVEVVKSTEKFNLTHAKTAVFDGKFALITTMNLTSAYRLTRDAGLVVEDKGTIDDLNTLFKVDLENAKISGEATPKLKTEGLVIAPANALFKLLSLIDSAQSEILVAVENFSPSSPLIERLAQAVKRGVRVKILAPFCNLNENPFFNFNALDVLSKNAAHVRVGPSPANESGPYMHQKMILVDSKRLFLGSENFSYNSLKKSREIGIIADAEPVLKQVVADFNSDWNASSSLPAQPAAACTVYAKAK